MLRCEDDKFQLCIVASVLVTVCPVISVAWQELCCVCVLKLTYYIIFCLESTIGVLRKNERDSESGI